MRSKKYIEALEKQNAELQEQLAEAEQKLHRRKQPPDFSVHQLSIHATPSTDLLRVEIQLIGFFDAENINQVKNILGKSVHLEEAKK